MKNLNTILSCLAICLSLFFVSCEQEEIKQEEINGCTDSNACNYNDEATNDDNSCQIPIDEILEITYLDLSLIHI